MKQTLLGTGLSGLVGSRIVELLKGEYNFTDLSFDTGVDVTNADSVNSKISATDASWILHLAAKTDVDGCEKEKGLGEQSTAWKINVGGTNNICAAAQRYHKRVIYISTDFIFDGVNDFYDETSVPNPLNWYAKTKYEGEKIVSSMSENIIMRISYPYKCVNTQKRDFVHVIRDQLTLGKSIQAVTDHEFTPTFIDNIAVAVNALIKKNASGIYHVVGDSTLSPYDAAMLIAQTYSLSKDLITPTKRSDFYAGRAVRPYKLRLKNAKITTLGVHMKGFSEGLEELVKQENIK